MTFRQYESDGVVFLRSDLLARAPGVEHAFSTRRGGVSPEPHDTLNLGFYSSDWNDNVTRNWDRYLAAAGVELDGVWYQNQTHGTTVREAPEVHGYAVLGEGDGLWTREPRTGLTVITADCLPVLLASADGRAVAAVHAGWKGLLGGVVEAALAALERGCGVEPRDLLVAVGPHIGACCFEVKDDVSGPFRARFGDSVVRTGADGRTRVSLKAALSRIAGGAGVPDGSLDFTDHCTTCNRELFFSYRRARGAERGRLAGFIARGGRAAS